MAGRYAARTEVSVSTSKAEIEALLLKYGADQFIHGWDETRAAIGFRIQSRMVRIYLPLPTLADSEIVFDAPNRRRPESKKKAALEQALRQRWRALLLIIKAKLEAVECGISTIEREFLSDVVLANGQTVGEWIQPQIEQMYQTKEMPKLLPA